MKTKIIVTPETLYGLQKGTETICKTCGIDLVPGIAIVHKERWPEVCKSPGYDEIINAPDMEIISCLKCPSCGRSFE